MKYGKENSEHGGDIYTEGLLKGRELIDFSSNINPLGIPESFLNNMDEAVRSLIRYPDIEYRELKKAICDYIHRVYINESNIVLGNGAAEVIDLAVGNFKKVMIVVPSFGEYEKSASKAAVQIEYTHLKEDMTIDYEDMLLKIRELNIEALIIANPNNPNGAIIDKEKFKPIMECCRERDIAVIIDEAFIEFTGNSENSFVDELETYTNIFIIRALTKFFALPGIRFGYGISKNERLIKEIKRKQNPWNVNCFAETAAKCVLKDNTYIKESLNWISEELPYLLSELEDVDIIDKVYESKCNFILCKLKDISCQELYDFCMEKGIAIRRASNFRGLDDSFVRFAVKDRDNNNKLLQVLRSYYL